MDIEQPNGFNLPGAALPALTPGGPFRLDTFYESECNHYVNDNFKIQNTMIESDYRGGCINANVLSQAIRFARINNPSADDDFARELDTWDSMKWWTPVGSGRQLCIHKGFHCLDEWYSLPSSDVCHEAPSVLGYISYHITSPGEQCDSIIKFSKEGPKTLSGDTAAPFYAKELPEKLERIPSDETAASDQHQMPSPNGLKPIQWQST